MARYIFTLRRGEKKTDENGAVTRDDWVAYKDSPNYMKPLKGELVLEYDNGVPRLKIGDGERDFDELEYLSVDSFILPKQISVTLYGSEDTDNADKPQWTKETDEEGNFLGRYKQVVEIDNAVITANSKVDLNPTPEMLAIFHEKDVTFVAENDNCVITVYCVGQKPQNTYLNIPVTVTEMVTTDKVVGNTTATPSPTPDWEQPDKTNASYIKNKPELGTLAAKSTVEYDDLDEGIKESLGKADNAIRHNEAQELTDEQKAQACANIGALSDTTVLADLEQDEEHRTVTNEEKEDWNTRATTDYVDAEIESLVDSASEDLNTLGKIVTELNKKIDAEDVPNWAKEENKPSYTVGEIDGAASTTYVDEQIASLVDTAPDTLNTLNELATALGNDENFATTVTTEIGKKVDKVEGKGLSTNDFTTEEKDKLNGIAEGANNYTHPEKHPVAMITGLADVATSGSYNDLKNKPTIPSAYTLPAASSTALGGIKVSLNGTVLTITTI